MTATDGSEDYYDFDDDWSEDDWPEDEEDEPEDLEDLLDMVERKRNEPVDRNGNPLSKGDKVRIVGKRGDSNDVYFASEMLLYLNNDVVYEIRTISEMGSEKYAVHLKYSDGRALDWSWACANIVRADVDIKVEPEIFEYDPKHLDI